MTVSSSTDRETYTGNGVATVFSLPFRFFENAEIQASLIVDATGVVMPLGIGTNYTLTGAGEPEQSGSATGQLTMLVAPAIGESLFVQRVIPVTQPTDLVNQGRFFPEIHENAFDRLTMLIQQSDQTASRALRVQDYDPVPNRLPGVVDRALKLLSFDGDGNPVAVAAAAQSATELEMILQDEAGAGNGAAYLGQGENLLVDTALSGAIRRTIGAVILDTADAKNWGAIGDGTFHPLSEFYGSLAAAQLVYPHATALTNSIDWAAIQGILNAGLNCYVPQGWYKFDKTIAVKFDGQALYGHGPHTTRLTLVGAVTNFIEMLSGRRDTAMPSAAKTSMRIQNFRVTIETGSTLECAFWMEAGTFHSNVEDMRFDQMTGRPSIAVFKMDSQAGVSYSLNPLIRRVTITGGLNDDAVAVPRGFWIEAVIEALFEQCSAYSCEDCWVLGTGTTANIRNIGDSTFIKCQGETGDRGYATVNSTSWKIWQGINLTFIGCKFGAGMDHVSPVAQKPLLLTGDSTFQSRNLNFFGCLFWGGDAATNGIVFDSAANYRDVSFYTPNFLQITGGVFSVDPAIDPLIHIEGASYAECDENLSSLRCIGFTHDPASLADGAGSNANSPDTVGFNKKFPALVSFSNDLQGVILTGYGNTFQGVGGGIWRFRFQNETGGVVDLASGTVRLRGFVDSEIRMMSSMTYDPASLADGAGLTATIAVHGAVLGDFVAVQFLTTGSVNLNGVLLSGYVSAAGVVSVRFQNETGGVVNLASGVLRAAVLAPKFDLYAAATKDPSSLADGAGETLTVAVPGAVLGDFAVCSFSLDLQGIIAFAYVSAADVVSIRLQNETGGVLDLGSGTMAVGVYKRRPL